MDSLAIDVQSPEMREHGVVGLMKPGWFAWFVWRSTGAPLASRLVGMMEDQKKLNEEFFEYAIPSFWGKKLGGRTFICMPVQQHCHLQFSVAAGQSLLSQQKMQQQWLK
jgi:hypothetical protein